MLAQSRCVLKFALTLLILLSVAPIVGAQAIANFDLPSQPLADSLRAVAEQTNTNVLFDRELVSGLTAPALKTQSTATAALARLLEGSGLTTRFVDEKTAVLESIDDNRLETKKKSPDQAKPLPPPEPKQPSTGAMHMAEGDPPAIRLAQAPPTATGSNPTESSSKKRVEVEEVVVTGTHIRGVTSSPSPMLTFDRNQIDMTGLGSVQEFIQRLPQNFNGGASEDTIAELAGGGGAGNLVNGAGVNLRGLGAGSTLVLLNGRRIAPGNTTGNFVDVSTIPLNAVERIEVVPDGASAIYGSDAVGGVMNFILRREFIGPETRVRYGSVTSGDSSELQLGQTAGTNWRGGSALLSYEYFNRSALDAKDRGRSPVATYPFNVLPEQKRHAALLTASHTTASGLELFADGTYARRHAPFSSAIENSYAQLYVADLDSFSATAGARTEFFNKFGLEISTSFGSSDTDMIGSNLFNGAVIRNQKVDTSVLSTDGKIDGSLWTTAAGPIRFAVGGQYRTEDFKNKNLLNVNSSYRNDRDVLAGFLELRVPLLGPSEAISTSRLELVLAGRHERYSDFGTSNNPKFGFVWKPISGLKFRGSYGTSFKAPILNDLNESPSLVFSRRVFDPQVSGSRNIVVIQGGNPDLAPEEATTWSIGAELNPSSLPGMHVELTYYDIEFENRIVTPSTTISSAEALVRESILGPDIVRRDPSSASLQELAGNRAFRNIFGVDPATAIAIVDYRSHNLSELDTSGIDLSLSYTSPTAEGQWEIGVDGTYILEYDTKFSSTAPLSEILNTPYNPVDLRLRGRGVLRFGNATLALFLNYTGSYTDNRIGVSRSVTSIESWTTADASIGYEFADNSGFMSNASAMLGVTNLSDEEPPFVANAAGSALDGIDFDGANANILGRFVYLQLNKRW